jgi:epoxyqueuosine reductase QueG
MELADQLTDMAKTAGASLIGFAPVERFDGAPPGHHPADLLPGARTVATFGIRLLDRVMEWTELLTGSPLMPPPLRLKALHQGFYRRSGYDIVNDQLNAIALRLANHLEDLGFASVFFPATYGNLPEELSFIPGMLSQRHAAVRAGLGMFGLNNVVVTPRYGPRIRFNSVITRAVLPATPLLAERPCRGPACGACLRACPADALSMLPRATEDQVWLDPPSRTNWSVCRPSQGGNACMGLCLRVCPTGRSAAAG